MVNSKLNRVAIPRNPSDESGTECVSSVLVEPLPNAHNGTRLELAGHDVLYEPSLGGLGRYLPVSIMSPLNNDINLIGVLAR